MTEHSRDKSKIRFLLLEGVHPSAETALRASGYSNVTVHRGALSGETLRSVLADAHFVGIRSRTRLSRELLENARLLAAIGCFCIGTDQVDLDAARDLGIPVFNSPFSNTRSVAELVLAEMILLLRGVAARNAELHRGVWTKSAMGAHEARGKTLGIVGYGHIGTQLSILAESIGMRVVYFDIVSKLALGNARATSTLDELLSISDVVTLHVPDTDSTRGMIGASQIERMKEGAVVLNASRGKVVQIDALADALRAGRITGAAIDVFPIEPQSNDEEFTSPLREFDNVILTPHIGGSTVEAQEKIGLEVAEKLIRYSDNGSTESAVNFPEVALPAHAGKHRVLHVHQNVPGVIAAINRVFSDNGINVSGQYLRTNDAIGYVVMDIDQESSAVARDRLREIPATIRCRVLH